MEAIYKVDLLVNVRKNKLYCVIDPLISIQGYNCVHDCGVAEWCACQCVFSYFICHLTVRLCSLTVCCLLL